MCVGGAGGWGAFPFSVASSLIWSPPWALAGGDINFKRIAELPELTTPYLLDPADDANAPAKDEI